MKISGYIFAIKTIKFPISRTFSVIFSYDGRLSEEPVEFAEAKLNTPGWDAMLGKHRQAMRSIPKNLRELKVNEEYKASDDYNVSSSISLQTGLNMTYTTFVTESQLKSQGKTRNVVFDSYFSETALYSMAQSKLATHFDSIRIKDLRGIKPSQSPYLKVRRLRVDDAEDICSLLSHLDQTFLREISIGHIVDGDQLTREKAFQTFGKLPQFTLDKLTIDKGNAAQFIINLGIKADKIDIYHFIPFSETNRSPYAKYEERAFIGSVSESSKGDEFNKYISKLKDRSSGIEYLLGSPNCTKYPLTKHLIIRGVTYLPNIQNNWSCKLETLTLGPMSHTYDSNLTGIAERLIVEVLVLSDKLIYNKTRLYLPDDRCQVEYLLV